MRWDKENCLYYKYTHYNASINLKLQHPRPGIWTFKSRLAQIIPYTQKCPTLAANLMIKWPSQRTNCSKFWNTLLENWFTHIQSNFLHVTCLRKHCNVCGDLFWWANRPEKHVSPWSAWWIQPRHWIAWIRSWQVHVFRHADKSWHGKWSNVPGMPGEGGGGGEGCWGFVDQYLAHL